IFIMHDAGYSPLNVARKVDQGEISGIQILNNTFYNTTGAGNDAVKMTSVVNGLVVDNVSIGYADFAQISGGGVTLSKNVSSGPYGMVDYVNFNFHLTSNSPLINAGIDDGLRDDFDGTSRPQGTSMDIGAFEYKP
ncbi:MAG TPA: choice-of-anchor Q domain-containing protein, partial [Anaerolineales bacterium]|nr:choice-of-anchor Q domain-containing protein [Anaerolineales bacterium]